MKLAKDIGTPLSFSILDRGWTTTSLPQTLPRMFLDCFTKRLFWGFLKNLLMSKQRKKGGAGGRGRGGGCRWNLRFTFWIPCGLHFEFNYVFLLSWILLYWEPRIHDWCTCMMTQKDPYSIGKPQLKGITSLPRNRTLQCWDFSSSDPSERVSIEFLL